MAKIMLFGTTKVSVVPYELEQGLAKLAAEGHEFIIGDSNGAETSIQMSLSRIGAINQTTIYAMDRVRSNKFKAKERIFKVAYDEESKTASIFDANTEEVLETLDNVEQVIDIPGDKRYYEFRDRLMVDECAIAMCLWNGDVSKCKREFHIIQLLGIHNKPCYTYKI